MREKASIQIWREVPHFSANRRPLSQEGVRRGEGVSREKLQGELRGPLAAALGVIHKSEEVM